MQAKDIPSLIRPNIQALTPYRSARDDFDEGILLDANENSFGSPVENDLQLHRYPMPTQDLLRKKIAAYRQVEMNNIFLGVGSDEPIDLLIRIFCEPGQDSLLITPPTYGMYSVSGKINNVQILTVDLDNEFQLNAEQILESTGDSNKIIFLCSPNNPTGNILNRNEILKLIKGFRGIVVVDEAYIDFSSEPSLAPLVTDYPNLVILQTFSKAFGLAGIRLGVAISSPEVIGYLMKVKYPYNINKFTADAGLRAFDNLELVNNTIRNIRDQRNKLTAQLEQVPSVEKIYPSDANFILFRIENALQIYKNLAGKGIIIRYRGNEPGCSNCLRVTIGTPDENRQFINTLMELVS